MTLYRNDTPNVYLPEKIFFAYVDAAYINKRVRTPFGEVDQLVIKFEVRHQSMSKRVQEKYNLPYSTMNKAGRAIQALLGNVPKEFDPIDILDKECHIRIEHRPLRNGGLWAGVAAVVPFVDPSNLDEEEILEFPGDLHDEIGNESDEYLHPNPDDNDDIEPDFFDDGSNGYKFDDDEEPPLNEDHGRYWPPIQYDCEM
ncbi:hypothetical protein J7E73_10250 [Paenibacillus albidus]|uniref:hypothetical protein n=1 Tax=Paenibacillus albidus TaxID=2041023 RepID=UPI001BEBEE0E|nr:hypothetical protein [Paenibacillus albidus]MBT2289506.1 hypothetical protein [Paenibacillus albidus]